MPTQPPILPHFGLWSCWATVCERSGWQGGDGSGEFWVGAPVFAAAGGWTAAVDFDHHGESAF